MLDYYLLSKKFSWRNKRILQAWRTSLNRPGLETLDLPQNALPVQGILARPDNPEMGNEQPDLEPEAMENWDRSQPRSETEYIPTNPDDKQEPLESIPPEASPTIIAPENVPIPDVDDDKLICDTLILTTDQIWRFEIEIDRQWIDMLRNDPQLEEFAFVVSTAKRQKVEVKLSTLTPQERQLFVEAKGKEIQVG